MEFESQQSILHELSVINFLIGLCSTWISHLPTHTRDFIRWKQLEIDEKNVFFLYFKMPLVRWVKDSTEKHKAAKNHVAMNKVMFNYQFFSFHGIMNLFFSLPLKSPPKTNELKITNDIQKKKQILIKFSESFFPARKTHWKCDETLNKFYDTFLSASEKS